MTQLIWIIKGRGKLCLMFEMSIVLQRQHMKTHIVLSIQKKRIKKYTDKLYTSLPFSANGICCSVQYMLSIVIFLALTMCKNPGMPITV